MEQLCEPTFLSHLAAVQHCLDTRDTRMCGSPNAIFILAPDSTQSHIPGVSPLNMPLKSLPV